MTVFSSKALKRSEIKGTSCRVSVKYSFGRGVPKISYASQVDSRPLPPPHQRCHLPSLPSCPPTWGAPPREIVDF